MSLAAAATPSVSSSRSAAKCATCGGVRARSRSNAISRTRARAVGESLFMMNSPDCSAHLNPECPGHCCAWDGHCSIAPPLITARGIDDVLQRLAAPPAVEIVAEHLDRAPLPAVIDAGAMRRDNHVLHIPKRTFLRQRLGLEDVEHGALEPAGLQRVEQRRLAHDTAARDIDQDGTRLQGVESRVIDQASGRR